ncbi:DUF502 domain-containing protein, partial [Sulfurovum sp. bin170]|uniref:DUF502 domain-containing protein n=1 Tax=Sulfurovum sp. bin170 TaxID=2695268 RepID=UPI0013DF1961
PIVAVTVLVLWLFEKIKNVVDSLFEFIGFAPQNHEFLWLLLAIVVFFSILYILGYLVGTRVASWIESLFRKIPGFETIRDVIGIFNSSKEGENRVLVVAIKGFATEGYNIGLMYSQKESIIKDHYTVTLSMTPIPNGGYMFEVHKDRIFVFEGATFDDNLQYLLSMGVKSMTEVLDVEPKSEKELVPFGKWLETTPKPR